MEERDKKTELLVGLFLTVGLALLALLILQFGAVRELFRHTYEITVPFPDGTGIREGTPVMLGGSKIGKVPRKPVLNATFNGVIIPLEVFQTVRIPSDAKFGIATAGLMGDSYIEIRPSGKQAEGYIEHGARISEANVVGTGGLGALGDTAKDLSRKVDLAIDDLRATLADLRISLNKINENAMSDANMKELKESFAHFNSVLKRLDEKTLGDQTSTDVREALTSFKEAAKSLEAGVKKLEPSFAKVDGIMTKADSVMASADKAMKSIDENADALGKIGEDLRKGQGLLPALIHDRSLKNEFSMLITNLRQRGVLWYKDKAGEDQPKPPLLGPKR